MKPRKQSKAKASEVTYELHSLGWKAFQNLCATLISEVWGQTIQTFFDSRDGGRDGAFHGTWKAKNGEIFTGAFTAQCKFTAKADKLLKLSDLNDDIAKAKHLAAKGLADNYLLLTNNRLTGENEEKIRKEFKKISKIKNFAIYGGERISQIIHESSRLRMLVPRIYGLGDLSQILDERAYAQATEILNSLGDDLSKFVITDAYRKSARALVEHGFVLLLGEPACGKSTIAAMLSVAAIDNWGCSTLKIRNADNFVTHSNPHEQKQFFWVDDAFGPTQLDFQSVTAWNHAFPHLYAAIRRGAKIVFTSRDYIYRSARNFLKESALPVIQESQVVIRVEKLSEGEREQILYNHIRLGTQNKDFKGKIKTYLPMVSAHPRFSPEIVRRLGNPTFTKQLNISRSAIEDFVEHPMDLLKEILRTLDASSKSAIALVFMRGGSLSSPVKLSSEEVQAIELLGGIRSELINALSFLDGSLLIRMRQDGDYFWRFKHPTIRDAFAAIVSENSDLMDIYLIGTPLEKVFEEVTCGEVGIEGVKVIVTANRYDSLIIRMNNSGKPSGVTKDSLNRFLARRCDKEFLEKYLAAYPEYILNLKVYSYLYAVSDVGVVVRLNHFQLLPEEQRIKHVETIRGLAVDIPDPGFLREDIKTLFTTEDFNNILEDIKIKLLPKLDECVDSWRGNYDDDEDPESYFDDLKTALNKYEEAFSSDVTAVGYIQNIMPAIDAAIIELQTDTQEELIDEDYYGGSQQAWQTIEERSVFEDVDQ